MIYYVYVIAQVEDESAGCHTHPFYKIGVSKDPESRLKQLQSSNGKKLLLIYAVEFESKDVAFKYESYCHAYAEKQRLNGEWFSSAGDDIQTMLCSIGSHSDIVYDQGWL